MPDLALQGFTAQEIKDALHGRLGSRCTKFRYDILRDGAIAGHVDATGSITLNRFETTQRGGRLTITGGDPVDWTHDLIKPYMLLRVRRDKGAAVLPLTCARIRTLKKSVTEIRALKLTCVQIRALRLPGPTIEQWSEFPLGVFVPSTPTRSFAGMDRWEVEIHDQAVILKEDCLSERTFFAAGTKYLAAVQQLLVTAGITDALITDPLQTQIPVDKEFEPGVSKLDAVNALLSEINCNPIWFDADGRAVVSRYQDPVSREPAYIYTDDELSVIELETTSALDLYGVPNVWIAVCDNPALAAPLRAEFINDDPSSIFSTRQRGRRIVSEIYRPDAAASQADLDEYIRKKAFDGMARFQEVRFTTALMPIHGSGDCIGLHHPDSGINGTYIETGWEMELKGDGKMTHTAQRAVIL